VTSKGSEVIKTMILGNENSALENKTQKVGYKEAVAHARKNSLKKVNYPMLKQRGLFCEEQG